MELTTRSQTTADSSIAPLEVYDWEPILNSVILAIISLIGIVGNSMIILAVLFSRKLQTSTNAFVISLGVADLVTSFFLIFMIVAVLGDGRWPIPDAKWLCGLTGLVTYTCTGASLYTLGVIAVNRLILIIHPFTYYSKLFKSWKLALWVLVPWLIPILANIVGLTTGLGDYGYDPADLTCKAIRVEQEESASFSIYTALIGFPIPFLMITISYVKIYHHLKKHFRRRKKSIPDLTSHENTTSSSAFTISYSESTISESGTMMRARRVQISHEQIEITKNLFLVVCAFFICFLPFFVLISIPGSRLNHAVFYVRLLTAANSAINFFIYARKHPDFKEILYQMLRCSYSQIPQPSRVLELFLSLKN